MLARVWPTVATPPSAALTVRDPMRCATLLAACGLADLVRLPGELEGSVVEARRPLPWMFLDSSYCVRVPLMFLCPHGRSHSPAYPLHSYSCALNPSTTTVETSHRPTHCLLIGLVIL